MSNFCILIPTVNRKDLLMEALHTYTTFYDNIDIFVLDNGKQEIPPMYPPNIHIYESKTNLGVAKSWNYLINRAIQKGFEWFLVLNDDIIFTMQPHDLKAIIKKYNHNTFHQPKPFYNWSVFLLSKYVFKKVGEFDTNFVKCYYEDNDYKYRMKLSGVITRYDDELAPQVYRNSETTKKDPTLSGFEENRAYYLKKWGGLPESEKFKRPFDDESI